ncbi:hypothetical protein BTO02_28810 [Paraburkholderia sp. SOS3]|nr:hypothetical protein BTO02_28810 [Paraburkholderia sp. SOS3]
MWFTAYGFGWGYRAFAVPYQVMAEAPDADAADEEQIRLAFESVRADILQAVLRHALSPYSGQRISLSLAGSHERGQAEVARRSPAAAAPTHAAHPTHPESAPRYAGA